MDLASLSFSPMTLLPPQTPSERPIRPAVLATLGAFGLICLGGALQPGGDRLAADDPVEDAPLENDLDGDGLHDDYEWILRSDEDDFDTDGDGYGDLEEFARGSSVFWDSSTPLPGDLSTRMIARQGYGVVHLMMATYVADGHVDGYATAFGMLRGDQLMLLPPDYVAQHATTQVIPLVGGGAVQVFEVPVRDSLFHGAGFLSFFGTVADANTGTVIVADVVDVKSDTASLFLRAQVKYRPNERADLANTANTGGSVYIPLPPPGQIPSTWNSGQICRQVSTVVGVVGGVVTREITAAECVEALDSYCKSDCAMSVGTVEQSVDPLTLVGG